MMALIELLQNGNLSYRQALEGRPTMTQKETFRRPANNVNVQNPKPSTPVNSARHQTQHFGYDNRQCSDNHRTVTFESARNRRMVEQFVEVDDLRNSSCNIYEVIEVDRGSYVYDDVISPPAIDRKY